MSKANPFNEENLTQAAQKANEAQAKIYEEAKLTHKCQKPCADYIFGGCGQCGPECHQPETPEGIDELVRDFTSLEGYMKNTKSKVRRRLSHLIETTRNEVLEEVEKILTDEINISHTEGGLPTARLTSACNRIQKLKK